MKVIKTYVAFDETEFDTEEECMAYEEELARNFAVVRESVVLFTAEGFPLKYENEDEFMLAYDNASYVLIKEDIMEQAVHFIEERGYGSIPTTRGFYYYGDYDWKSITNLIAPIYEDLKENGFI